MELKQVKLDLTATKVVKNEDYVDIPLAKGMGIIDREKFDTILNAARPNVSLKDTLYGGRIDVVFEGRKDGKLHLLGVEISKQELDPDTGNPLLPIQHPLIDPDYRVKFLTLEEPLKSELVEGINRRMHLALAKD
ncbi:MAG: hypothetical protein NTY73_04675 [Candidatus Micrarchaeota archaeon]|nr:hypothetical protein [Candidatus Micrarchaeota archaeon]